MSANISEMEPYVISLDSIDKQYIYRNIYTPDSDLSKVRPLWSRQSLNEEEQYYEFQIIPENVKEEPQRHKEYARILCHVCNINIPIVFLKEHYASEKHNTFKKLTKKVLDRVAKSINMCTYIDTNVPNNLYYCTSCSVVVSDKEKLLHDLSDEHTKSLKYDKHMSEFLNLYIDKDYKMNCDNNCDAKFEPITENSDIDMTSSLFSTENSISVYNRSSTSTIESINDTDISSLVKTKNNNEIKMNVNNDITNRNGAITEKKYSDQINDTKTNVNNDTLKTTGAIKEKPVTIQSDNGDIKTYLNNDAPKAISVVKEQTEATPDDGSFKDEDSIFLYTKQSEVLVPLKSYHGFIDTFAKTFCKLCSTLIEGATKVHVSTVKHLSFLTKPIDNNFIREMNASLCHCIICNVIIYRTDKNHVKSDAHKKLLNDYTKNFTKRRNQTYCKPCDRYIDTNNYLSHIKGQKHILSRFNTNVKENFEFITEGRRPSEKICCICNVYIPNTDKNIDEHIKAGNHTTNMMNLITNNKIIILSDNYYYCEICNIDFDNLMSHIKIKLHKLGLCPQEVPSKRANETGNTPINKNVVKNFLPQPIVKHNNDIKKIGTVSKNTVESDPIFDNNFCDVCKVKLPLNGRSVHEAGKNHKQQLSTLGITSNTVAGLKNVNDALNLINDTNESLQYKNHIYNEFMELTDNNQMLCKLCKNTVGNNEPHINEHIRGKKHCIKLQMLMGIFKPPS